MKRRDFIKFLRRLIRKCLKVIILLDLKKEALIELMVVLFLKKGMVLMKMITFATDFTEMGFQLIKTLFLNTITISWKYLDISHFLLSASEF